VVAAESAPKSDDEEMVIVQDILAFIECLRGLYVPAMISLFTGMLIGEVLALRWGRVDLEGKVIQVREEKKPRRTASGSRRRK
jgi:integrase